VFEQWMRSFLLGRGFTELHTPKLMGAASESGAEVFRVEPSFTARHATEFTGLDLEMAWIDSVDDVMRMEEELLAHAVAGVRDALGRQIEEVFGTDLVVPTTPVPRVTLAEAREQLLGAG
jgi:aspartyl/asparaginyl-tRNA synthetase